jgi:peptidyl-prolyl cis-trans isomerase SurA
MANAGNEILFTLQGKGYSVKDFLGYVESNQRSSTMAPEKYLDLLYQQCIDTTILKLLEERISAQHPEYRYLLQEYYEGILLFDVMEKEVWSKASLDSAGQQTYYETHKTDYATGERARVAFYSAATNQFREPLRQLILEGI